jgi:Tol biopolymer transport system component
MVKKTIYIIIILIFPYNIFAQENSLEQITFSDSTRVGFPNWSPDGNYLYFGSSNKNTCITIRISSNGDHPTRITDYFTQHAKCSPDGKYLVFDAEFGSVIQICSSEGGIPIRIVPENIPIIRSGMPCWSPDGKTIAFHSNGFLWTLELGSGEFQKIYQIDNKVIAPFDWTSDGNFIIADVRDTINRGQADIWKIPINKNENEAKQLTFIDGYQVEPNVSPDGSMIVYSSWTVMELGMDLFIMSSDGGESLQITFDKGHEAEACWSPDGKKIAFSSVRSGYWAIWTIEPNIETIKEKLNIE